MAMMFCPECGKQISDRAESCINCGYPINQYFIENNLVREWESKQVCPECQKVNRIEKEYCEECGNKLKKEVLEKKKFTGIYTTDIFGLKTEVYCPRCKSSNCSHYSEEIVIPGKTKTRYTANLNPLKPFTLVNKKEKQVKKDKVKATPMIRCNDCGKTWKV